jgi:hypothetical protein
MAKWSSRAARSGALQERESGMLKNSTPRGQNALA